jgi:hypothetical protein
MLAWSKALQHIEHWILEWQKQLRYQEIKCSTYSWYVETNSQWNLKIEILADTEHKSATSHRSFCHKIIHCLANMNTHSWIPWWCFWEQLRSGVADHVIFFLTALYEIILWWLSYTQNSDLMCLLNMNFVANCWICHPRSLCHGMVSPLPIMLGMSPSSPQQAHLVPYPT